MMYLLLVLLLVGVLAVGLAGYVMGIGTLWWYTERYREERKRQRRMMRGMCKPRTRRWVLVAVLAAILLWLIALPALAGCTPVALSASVDCISTTPSMSVMYTPAAQDTSVGCTRAVLPARIECTLPPLSAAVECISATPSMSVMYTPAAQDTSVGCTPAAQSASVACTPTPLPAVALTGDMPHADHGAVSPCGVSPPGLPKNDSTPNKTEWEVIG